MKTLIKNYMNFLDNGKTERLCALQVISMAEKAGYKNIDTVKKIKAGDKVYYCKMGKAVILWNVGSDSLENGMNILGAHIDSPRLDVKPNPVYEKDGVVYLNTHYYGGIKKYQWVTIPLAMIGVVCLSNGKTVNVNIGDDPSDPVFCISDILPHLAQSQMTKTASEFIEAEKLDVILGCAHREDEKEEKDLNKKAILNILKKKYKFEEEDFNSAELEIVPAGKARFTGLDESLVLGYGQDDRVCAYTSVAAILETGKTKRTLCCILADKEEIGSNGATGMDSHYFDNAVAELIAKTGSYNELTLRRCLSSSYMLSSDVNSAYDPLNAELFDRQNASFLSKGVVLNKYTGSRGKSAASDANAEFIAKIRNVLSKNKVHYQMAELGKVDIGGGGTIAKYCANFGMQVIDCGVPVLSMHAPWEITSTYDIESAFNCYRAFLTLE